MMRESEIEKILREEVREIGGRAYKWVSPGNDGVPDRIVIFPGQRPIFVELKTKKGTLSALQHIQIPFLRGLGQDVYVVHGIHQLIDFFMDCGYMRTAERIRIRYGDKETPSTLAE